ncbi:MAG TPA: nucleotide sugar dehydrogenase [Rhodospirillaceae bacterium]|nr:nucleotide sugar dehydrogenase [Rhodospirillaceae bacterium]
MSHPRIAVIGLGYVGLPLAVAVARYFPTVGFDIDPGRIAELRRGEDRTGEVPAADLRQSALELSAEAEAMRGAEVFIVTVPTPVTADNQPDLGPLMAACRTVGAVLGKGAVVVFESTVYPGVTEDICGPALEQVSSLTAGRDFFLGYSPERINPGDREHGVEHIVKVVAGQTPAVTDRLAQVYGTVTRGGVHRAASIRVAEAAKAIENAQRDINIAFINEVSMICRGLGISVHDVLDTAGTKWNFLPFKPGLVGGHCIGVDPFYLAECARAVGHHPEIILAGRRINDGMGQFVADAIHQALDGRPSDILVLGLTFKENVPDLRNTKVVDVVARLSGLGHRVSVHDACADPAAALAAYGLALTPDLVDGRADCLLGAVAHRAYADLPADRLAALVRPGGLIADLKGMWRGLVLPDGLRRWQL